VEQGREEASGLGLAEEWWLGGMRTPEASGAG
jgi:hypothetical protein